MSGHQYISLHVVTFAHRVTGGGEFYIYKLSCGSKMLETITGLALLKD
jgi:hypothetical protein